MKGLFSISVRFQQEPVGGVSALDPRSEGTYKRDTLPSQSHDENISLVSGDYET